MDYTVISETDVVSDSRADINENARTAGFKTIASKTADFTVWADDSSGSVIDVYYVDATSGAVTVTLPTLASGDASDGRAVTVMKIDSGGSAVTLTPPTGETVKGSSTHALSGQWDSVTIVERTSTDWAIIASTT